MACMGMRLSYHRLAMACMGMRLSYRLAMAMHEFIGRIILPVDKDKRLSVCMPWALSWGHQGVSINVRMSD